ncbi:hypothetical protein BDY21DRAFT_65667 [Lineolata rhizophorae]|uniref:Uncharacterized protein n=1 Tax=Lineolata rhizophorae TaxID=578093 RepID=A0A6A6NWX5_9PEZI|nr:hypothetical protein BDY21DRAFT_65667 [Lineolata rhizophorae]
MKLHVLAPYRQPCKRQGGEGGDDGATSGREGKRGIRTKSSAASKAGFFCCDATAGSDMSIRAASSALLAVCGRAGRSSSFGARKGFRETGRLGWLLALLKLRGEGSAGDGKAGEAARLRKGLLEDRLSVSPGEGRRSIIDILAARAARATWLRAIGTRTLAAACASGTNVGTTKDSCRIQQAGCRGQASAT